jgi:hypothetical protein
MIPVNKTITILWIQLFEDGKKGPEESKQISNMNSMH